MPVNTPCKKYLDKLEQWSIVRDCIEGQLAIWEGGIKYLPKPSGQSQEEYINYQKRTVFFDGTNRTAEGLHGHIFAKDPVQSGEISDGFKALLDNVDGSGTSIDEFASNITWDAIQTAWGGILVDHVSVPEGETLAEKNGGAFLKWYNAESIINLQYSVIDGAKILTLVVLREDIEEKVPDDEFVTVITEAYRVLAFDNESRYYQRLFVKNSDAKDSFLQSATIYPKINGEYFNFIPFYTCPGEVPEKSMLLGLAFENIGHYQKTAEYENGLYLTSFATPIAVNMEQPHTENKKTNEKKIQKVLLGGSQFKFFLQRNSDGTISPYVDVKYLEFTGTGLAQLLNALNNCLDRMAKLGIQAIGAEKKGVETAEVAKIHRASENGVLGAFARSMSNKITNAVRLMAKWNLIPDDEVDAWSYQLNNDFNHAELSAQILSIMHTARQSGEIPRSVWLAALKRCGMAPESMTEDEFAEAIQSDYTGGHGPDGDEKDI